MAQDASYQAYDAPLQAKHDSIEALHFDHCWAQYYDQHTSSQDMDCHTIKVNPHLDCHNTHDDSQIHDCHESHKLLSYLHSDDDR